MAVLIFTIFQLKYSISFHYECRQETTVVLATNVILSLVETIDVFILHSCWRYLKISFICIVTYKSLLELVTQCVNKATYILQHKFLKMFLPVALKKFPL